MTLLMCKFVDSEMEQDLMQENSVLFKPTIKKDESSKPISDIGKDSSSDQVSDIKTVHPVVEEVRTSEITSQDTDFEGDVCDTTTVSKKDLDKKRKSPEKPAIAMEEDKISPTKKAKAIVGEQGSPISFEQDDVDQAKELAKYVNVNDQKSEAIGEELKDFTYKDDNTDPSNEITENKDDTLLITGSKNKIMTTADDVISHVNENNVKSEKVTPISTELKNEDPVSSVNEEIGREHNSNSTNLKEINEVVEKNSLDTDVKLVTVKDLVDNGNPEDTSENSSNIPNSLNANDKKDASPKDSTRNDNLDQDNKMDEVVDKELKTDLDSSQTELNDASEEVENMDDSQLLTDPAILEAIKLSEITASKELDGVIEDSEEMEEESEEEEEEPEEPWKPEDYKIYSSSKEFSTLRQPRKSFMKTFRKALASIRFNSTTEPAPHGGNDQKKGSEKDETVPSQVNFLLNVGLAETVPAKNKEEERLRRLDKISKLSNKAKLRMGRRSLKRLEDRFRANLVRTVQQNTEVSTLCKEMLILDLNPTKYLWGSALLRKRELSKKLKEWFKQAKLTEAEELKNPFEDNPSLPSKLLRFTSCDTSAAPRLLLAIKIGKAGLDLKWQSTVDQADFSLLATRHYELQCCHASTPWELPSEWKTIGNIKAMPLPMACTIRKFEAGHIYSFKIRAVKSKKDRSEWSEPVSIAL